MKELKIGENEAGQRLDKMLGKYLSEAPKSFLYKMLRKKNITLNGKKAEGKELLRVGDLVKLFLSDETIQKFSGKVSKKVTGQQEKLDILYEDEHVMLINKPVGLLSQKAKADDISLVELMQSYLLEKGALTGEQLRTFKPSVCNRLDRNTSGIVIAGKSLPGLQKMSALLKERSLKKYYRALVKGVVTKPYDVQGWLKKNEKTNQVTIHHKELDGGAYIETAYEPVACYGSQTLLEVHLITGKTHQIRAHLAAMGHPLIGDYKYGDRKLNEQYKKKYGLKSQMLHAYRLEFPKLPEPFSALSNQVVTAKVPAYFQKIIDDCKR